MSKPRVLIIDDDPHYCELMGVRLEGRFDFAFCHTVADGVLSMKTRQPDAVLLDLRLPDSNSKPKETLARVKEVRTTAAIIVITAADVSREEQSELVAGNASGVLQKGRDDANPDLISREINDAITNFRFTEPVIAITKRLKGA